MFVEAQMVSDLGEEEQQEHILPLPQLFLAFYWEAELKKRMCN